LIGTIANVLNFGAGDILDVRPELGDNLLLPFTKKVVPIVEIANRRVIVDMPDEVIVREEDAGEGEA
jgi:16S rRNA processing protein RimM